MSLVQSSCRRYQPRGVVGALPWRVARKRSGSRMADGVRTGCPGSGGDGLDELPGSCASTCNGSSDSTQFIHQCDQHLNNSQMYISAVNFPLVFMFSVRRQMSPVSARRVAFVFRHFRYVFF